LPGKRIFYVINDSVRKKIVGQVESNLNNLKIAKPLADKNCLCFCIQEPCYFFTFNFGTFQTNEEFRREVTRAADAEMIRDLVKQRNVFLEHSSAIVLYLSVCWWVAGSLKKKKHIFSSI
jgi:hypothetical protein